MKKIALVIGHNAKAQGAIRVTDKVPEFVWNRKLALMIQRLDPALYQIFERPAGLGYYAEIKAAYGQIGSRDFAASLELHFNSVADPRATGTETLSSGTRGSVRMAGLVQVAMVNCLGLRDRGIKVLDRKARGGASLWAGGAPAVMLEPYFGSNSADCVRVDARIDNLARALHTACKAFVEV